MEKELTKVIKGGKELIKVSIETENNYFSITGIIGAKAGRGQRYIDYIEHNNQKYEIHSGGCIHEDILKHFPNLQPIIRLHLSSLEGVPMYALENGLCWFKEDKGLDYIRYEGDRSKVNSKIDFKRVVGESLEAWKKEAEEVLKLIENL